MSEPVTLWSIRSDLQRALALWPHEQMDALHTLYREVCKATDHDDDDIKDVVQWIRIETQIVTEDGAYLGTDHDGHVVIVREPVLLSNKPAEKLLLGHSYKCHLEGDWWIADPSEREGRTD